MSSHLKPIGVVVLIATTVAVALSMLWRVPYIFTFVSVATWLLVGHLITIDDDLPGGWSNPDGSHPFPWRELVIKIAVFVLLVLAALVPAVRALGR